MKEREGKLGNERERERERDGQTDRDREKICFDRGTDKGFQSKRDYLKVNKGKGHCPIVAGISTFWRNSISRPDDITFD